ncbi:MAG: hypothetical protein ACYC0J_06685, partial [Gammaproteobacteria bacterium]
MVKEGAIGLSKENYDTCVANYAAVDELEKKLQAYKNKLLAYQKTKNQLAGDKESLKEHQETFNQCLAEESLLTNKIEKLTSPTGERQETAVHPLDGTETEWVSLETLEKELASVKSRAKRQQSLIANFQTSIATKEDFLKAADDEEKIDEKQFFESISGPYKEYLTSFQAAINQATILNNAVTIRLIGDELADRGVNDLFILHIYTMLNSHKVSASTLISNHGAEFIIAYNQAISTSGGSFKAKNLLQAQSASLAAIQDCIDLGVTTAEEVKAQVEKSGYLKTIKIIDYALTPDHGIAIYSHAPVDIELIESLAFYLNVPFNDDTAIDLAISIEHINIVFQENLKGNTLDEMLANQAINLDYMTAEDKQFDPIAFALWNRNYAILKREKTHKNYSTSYLHGHDPSGKNADNILNLDNQLGKTFPHQRGLYETENNDGTGLSKYKVEIHELYKKIKKLIDTISTLDTKPKETEKNAIKEIANTDGYMVEQKIALLYERAMANLKSKDPIFAEIRKEVDAYRVSLNSIRTAAEDILFSLETDRAMAKLDNKLPLSSQKYRASPSKIEAIDAKAPDELAPVAVPETMGSTKPNKDKPASIKEPTIQLSKEQQANIASLIRTATSAETPDNAGYLLSMISTAAFVRITDIANVDDLSYKI